MKYNTIPIKNIDDEEFIGGYAGVQFKFEPGEKRYLPSDVSKHLAEHLAVKIIDKNKARDLKDFESTDSATIKGQILSEEIATAEQPKKMTFAEEVAQHEADFKAWKEDQRKQEVLQKEKAMDIAKDHVGETV